MGQPLFSLPGQLGARVSPPGAAPNTALPPPLLHSTGSRRPLPATSFSSWSECCVNTKCWGFMFTHEPEGCAFYILVPIWWLGTPARVAPERWKYSVKRDSFCSKRENTNSHCAHSAAPPFLSSLLLGTVDCSMISQAGGVCSPDPPRLRPGEVLALSPRACVLREPRAAARWLCCSSPFCF